MEINKELLDTLSAQAKASPRLRQAYDLRTTPEDNSQRILNRWSSERRVKLELFRVVTEEDEVNAMEPGTILPIHRHISSTVVRQAHQPMIVVLRGKIRQNFYDESGQLVESFIVSPCSDIMGFSVELGRWHNTECLESGTVILECRNGKYEAMAEEDILK